MSSQKKLFDLKHLDSKLRSPKLVPPLSSSRRAGRLVFWSWMLLVAVLVVVPWQQTAPGQGRVVAFSPNDREQEISAPVDGRIDKWFVQEGTKVKEGDRIVSLSDNDPEIISRLSSERDAVLKSLNAAEVAVQVAKVNLDRQQDLFEKGLSSRRDFEASNLEYSNYLVKASEAAAKLAQVDVKLARQLTQEVRAPREGTILRVLPGQGGQLVKAGAPLAVIIPDTDSRAVELFVKGNDVPLIQEGDKVRLQFEGWPALQFSGWPSIAVGTFGGKVALIDASDSGHGKFRILVVPEANESWPDQNYLRQGVRAKGWVLLQTVRLWFELWRQFNGFPPSRSSPSDEVLKPSK